MTGDFLLGTGEQSRYFGPDSPESRAMKDSALTGRATDYFYETKNRGWSPGTELKGVYNYEGHFGPTDVLAAGTDPIEQYHSRSPHKGPQLLRS